MHYCEIWLEFLHVLTALGLTSTAELLENTARIENMDKNNVVISIEATFIPFVLTRSALIRNAFEIVLNGDCTLEIISSDKSKPTDQHDKKIIDTSDRFRRRRVWPD